VTCALRLLLLEDDAHDAKFVRDLLEAGDFVCDVVHAQTRAEFLAALDDPGIDLILADYSLPSFDGLSALKLALSARPDLPFIFVSGTLGEEVATEALKIGATDYVLKTRLPRLVPAVQRALREARERIERKKAEEALRLSEMYLAEAQRLSHTGSFGWDPSSGDVYWSDETYRIFDCEPTARPTIQLVIDRTHPDDRLTLQQVFGRTSMERSEFVAEPRLMLADGSVKYVRVVARCSASEDPGKSVFVGAVTDVTERNRAEEERARLCQLEAELTRINRVSMMGEVAASLAHEIRQPLTAAINRATACAQWLHRDVPDLEEARVSASAMVAAAMHASDIVDRVGSLYRRDTPREELVQLNAIVWEMTILLDDRASRSSISIGTELDRDLPVTIADRVQLQQVLMNLMLNGIEAMQDTGGELTVASKKSKDGQLFISVCDSGSGLSAKQRDRLFEAFFTTKPQGTGMGLSISRRIIESHGGRLWATANTGRGATFQFTLPVRCRRP
jgi:signal transduction histidine kinase/CheY-like chemotaxis protein